MARAKRKTEPKLKASDYLGLLANYMEEVLDALGFGEDDEIVAPNMPMDFGMWVAEERDFINIPSSKELKDKEPEDAMHILRQKALMLVTRFFDAECENDLHDAVANEKPDIKELLQQEEWKKAMHDFIENDEYAFYSNEDIEGWQTAALTDEVQDLDEAIASNAIAELEKKIEGANLTEEEFAIGLANENGIEVPESDTEASVDSFIESIATDDHGPDRDDSYGEQVPVTRQEVPGSYLLWKWEIKAVIEKHKTAINDGHPVTALANGAKELVDSGAVTTKGGLLDALLELIEAKPEDALIIVKCFEQLK